MRRGLLSDWDRLPMSEARDRPEPNLASSGPPRSWAGTAARFAGKMDRLASRALPENDRDGERGPRRAVSTLGRRAQGWAHRQRRAFPVAETPSSIRKPAAPTADRAETGPSRPS